jgi:hypothetical protein
VVSTPSYLQNIFEIYFVILELGNLSEITMTSNEKDWGSPPLSQTPESAPAVHQINVKINFYCSLDIE